MAANMATTNGAALIRTLHDPALIRYLPFARSAGASFTREPASPPSARGTFDADPGVTAMLRFLLDAHACTRPRGRQSSHPPMLGKKSISTTPPPFPTAAPPHARLTS